MELGHHAVGDAQLAQQLRAQAVGLHVPGLEFRAVVVPDHVAAGVEVAGGQHLRRQAQRRQVVAVEHHQHRLVVAAEGVQQFADELIHRREDVDVVLEGREVGVLR